MRIIDCQSHWTPRAYYEAHLKRSTYPMCEKRGDGYLFHHSPHTTFPVSRHVLDLDLQFEQMDSAGVTAIVSSCAPLALDALSVADGVALAQLLNHEKAAAQRRHQGRFWGLAAIPLRDPDAAITVLEHAVIRLGLRGVCLFSNVNGQPIDSELYWPVYQKLQDVDVPIVLHPAPTVVADRLTKYGLEFSLGFVFDTSTAALRLALSGLLDKFQRLKIVVPHLGGTLPYLSWRIDFESSLPRAGNIHLQRAPTEYLKEFYTDTVSGTPGALDVARAFYGRDRILFGSDYPYWQLESSIEFVRKHISDDEIEHVMFANAQRLFELAV